MKNKLKSDDTLPIHSMRGGAPSVLRVASQTTETSAALLRELVAHLRQNRTQLREEWARRITDAQLLTTMSNEEIFSEATSVYEIGRASCRERV